MPLEIKVDTSRLEAKLLQKSVVMKQSLGKVLRDEGRLLAVTLAKYTQPFGLDKKAQTLGQGAVVRDYRRVYPALATGFILNRVQLLARPNDKQAIVERVQAYVAAGNTGAIQRMLNSMHIKSSRRADPQVHAARWSGGKLHKGTTQVVINQKTINTLINKARRRVGFAKSGWAECARQLGGTRGIPGWVSRQKAPGRVIDQTASDKPSLTLINQINYTEQVLSRSGQAGAIRERATKIQLAIDRAVKFGVKDK